MPSGEPAPNPKTNGEKKDGRIKPGEVRNPAGRPKGSRHKLGSAFLDAMLDDFTKHGTDVISVVREEKPDQYLKVVASILPKEIEVGEDTIDSISQMILARRQRSKK